MSKVVTLLTDFGLSDSYVAQMKGCILSLCPSASIVDLSHEIPACDIHKAARFLQESCAFFPAETIHLAVVDPGVGGLRRRLILAGSIPAEHEKGLKRQWFVGPDNGIFSFVLPKERRRHVWEISRFEQLPNYPNGQTFEGRNIFAPVAALLAEGIAPEKFGAELPLPTSLIELENYPPPISIDGILKGQIVQIDRFGNAATNLGRQHLSTGRNILSLPRKSLRLELRNNFEAFPPQTAGCIINSQGFLEIVANRTSAHELLELKLGESVHLTFG